MGRLDPKQARLSESRCAFSDASDVKRRFRCLGEGGHGRQFRSSIWSIVSFLTFGFRARLPAPGRADENAVTDHDHAARTFLTKAKSPAEELPMDASVK